MSLDQYMYLCRKPTQEELDAYIAYNDKAQEESHLHYPNQFDDDDSIDISAINCFDMDEYPHDIDAYNALMPFATRVHLKTNVTDYQQFYRDRNVPEDWVETGSRLSSDGSYSMTFRPANENGTLNYDHEPITIHSHIDDLVQKYGSIQLHEFLIWHQDENLLENHFPPRELLTRINQHTPVENCHFIKMTDEILHDLMHTFDWFRPPMHLENEAIFYKAWW